MFSIRFLIENIYYVVIRNFELNNQHILDEKSPSKLFSSSIVNLLQRFEYHSVYENSSGGKRLKHRMRQGLAIAVIVLFICYPNFSEYAKNF